VRLANQPIRLDVTPHNNLCPEFLDKSAMRYQVMPYWVEEGLSYSRQVALSHE